MFTRGHISCITWNWPWVGLPSSSIGGYKRRKGSMNFSEWYGEFRGELTKLSGANTAPKGMDKESYRESYDEGMTPSERAWQELDDLSR